MDSLHWNRLLAGPHWKPRLEQVCWQDLGPPGESMLEQFVKNYSLWEALTLEKFTEGCLHRRDPMLEQWHVCE